jgi:hypothetical protein
MLRGGNRGYSLIVWSNYVTVVCRDRQALRTSACAFNTQDPTRSLGSGTRNRCTRLWTPLRQRAVRRSKARQPLPRKPVSASPGHYWIHDCCGPHRQRVARKSRVTFDRVAHSAGQRIAPRSLSRRWAVRGYGRSASRPG